MSDSNSGPEPNHERIIITQEDIEALTVRIVQRRSLGQAMQGGLLAAFISTLVIGAVLASVGQAMLWAIIIGLLVQIITTAALYRRPLKDASPIRSRLSEHGNGGNNSLQSPPTIIIRPEDLIGRPRITRQRESRQASDTAVTPNSADTFCPYCGQVFATGPTHICQHCLTPHHPGCWTANRGCTTFGCRSARSVR